MIHVDGEVPFYKFEIFKPYNGLVEHGVSTRHGGVSKGYLESLNLGMEVGDTDENLKENYKRFCEAVGVDGKNLIYGFQRHTDKILTVDEANFKSLEMPIDETDGFVTNLKGCALLVRFADCQGVLMFDPVKRVIAAVHSGWRGNVQNIIGKAVFKMVGKFGCNAADIVVGISPSLGPCCAEFTDPFKELPESMHKYVNGRKVDLWRCSFEQLTAVGIQPSNIEIARRCTVCENKEFFSYRAGQKRTGHMGGIIALR